MHRIRALALSGVTALLAAGAASSAQAASWLSVGPNDLCGADGCFASSKTFKQTFSSSGRQGVVDIASLAIFRNIVGSSTNAVKISFQLADGTEVSWGKFSLAVLGGDVVNVAGQRVAWDTSLGDLTVKLDLVVPEKGGAGGGGFGGGGFGGEGFDSLVGRGIASGGGAPFDLQPGGPLVRPSLPQQSLIAVPEPGAWALMILGFAGAGAALRRSRALALRFG